MKKYLSPFIAIFSLAAFSIIGHAGEPESSPLPETPPSYWTVEEQAKGLEVDLEKEFPDTYITVVYFHRLPSCPSCQMMARGVFSVLKESYAEDLKTRKINLKYVNFEAKENGPIVEVFGVKKPTVILFESSPDGVRSRRAWRIWDMAGNEAAFKGYILKEVKDFIEAGNKPIGTNLKNNK